MSTISNERLGAFILGSQPWNEEIEQMATELLALRERAEPVAYISKADLDAGYPHILARKEYSKACPMAVYSAPPAPVVPDAYIRDGRGRMMLNGRQEPRIGYSAGWNACRAAMLRGTEDATS